MLSLVHIFREYATRKTRIASNPRSVCGNLTDLSCVYIGILARRRTGPTDSRTKSQYSLALKTSMICPDPERNYVLAIANITIKC